VPAAAQELNVDLQASNVVRFISKAPLDEFEGITDRIDGYTLLGGAGLDGAANAEHTEIYFEVDLASLDTGIGLRNRHMRDRYLEIESYPYAAFRGAIQTVELVSPNLYRVVSSGTMTLHGVERPLTPECRVRATSSRTRVRCEFSLLLSDFEIEIPRLMFMKINDEVRIVLDYWLSPVAPGD
jgi:polyisoprenoid-binding protein YceI